MVENYNPSHLALTDEQNKVLVECLTKLAENGIGLGHDYHNMGTLFAYNKLAQKENGYEVRTYGIGDKWRDYEYEVNDHDVIDGILDNVTYLDYGKDSPFNDAEYLFLEVGDTYIYPNEVIEDYERKRMAR